MLYCYFCFGKKFLVIIIELLSNRPSERISKPPAQSLPRG